MRPPRGRPRSSQSLARMAMLPAIVSRSLLSLRSELRPIRNPRAAVSGAYHADAKDRVPRSCPSATAAICEVQLPW
jgi:hypothetical protein